MGVSYEMFDPKSFVGWSPLAESDEITTCEKEHRDPSNGLWNNLQTVLCSVTPAPTQSKQPGVSYVTAPMKILAWYIMLACVRKTLSQKHLWQVCQGDLSRDPGRLHCWLGQLESQDRLYTSFIDVYLDSFRNNPDKAENGHVFSLKH